MTFALNGEDWATAANVVGTANVIDTLIGYGARDIMYDGAGTDAMTGGAGADSLIFEAASVCSNIDTISDFNTMPMAGLRSLRLLPLQGLQMRWLW